MRQKPFSRAVRDRSLGFRAHRRCERGLLHLSKHSGADRAWGHRTGSAAVPRGRAGEAWRPHPRRHGCRRPRPRPLRAGPGTPPVEPRGGGEAGHDSCFFARSPAGTGAFPVADGARGGRCLRDRRRGRPAKRRPSAPLLDGGGGGRPGGTWPTRRQSGRPRP